MLMVSIGSIWTATFSAMGGSPEAKRELRSPSRLREGASDPTGDLLQRHAAGRGPKPPITTMTISMQIAMKTNTAVFPPSPRKNAMASPEIAADSRLQE